MSHNNYNARAYYGMGVLSCVPYNNKQQMSQLEARLHITKVKAQSTAVETRRAEQSTLLHTQKMKLWYLVETQLGTENRRKEYRQVHKCKGKQNQNTGKKCKNRHIAKADKTQLRAWGSLTL